MKPNECGACGAQIVWARTQRGERMPVDAEPHPDLGNVVLVGSPPRITAGVLSKGQAAGARAAGQRLHLSHFVTCPKAGEFRKRDRR